MVEVLERAVVDSGSTTILASIDEITAIPSFTWHAHDPALLVAQRLGLDVTTRRIGAGGNMPQQVGARLRPANTHKAKCARSRSWAPNRCTRDFSRNVKDVNSTGSTQSSDVPIPEPARRRPGATDGRGVRTGSHVPDERLPTLRERAPGPSRLDDFRSPRTPRSALVELRDGRRDESLRLDPRRAVPGRDRYTEYAESDDLLPVYEVVGGQHAGRHGGDVSS